MKKLSLIVCALVALMIAAACGPSDPNTNGTGGHGSSTSSITGTGGNTTSNGGGGTGGDVNVCYVWAEDPFATSDPTCEVCLCSVVPGATDQAYCELRLSQGLDVCPAGGNTCEPGINRCGYDLPPGQAYEWPDDLCKFFVSGDTWTSGDFDSTWGGDPRYYDQNGQLRINQYVMSGRVLYYQMFNPQTAVGSSICTFDANCKMMTCTDEPSGTIHTYWWLHH